jgi:hypothetical protein
MKYILMIIPLGHDFAVENGEGERESEREREMKMNNGS